jgi:plasmid stabilization system protein ParE
MNFEVVWTPAAEAELARIWMDTDNRRAITAAAAETDRLLATTPHDVGESREGRSWILFVWPLAVFYEVDANAKRVLVRRIRRM